MGQAGSSDVEASAGGTYTASDDLPNSLARSEGQVGASWSVLDCVFCWVGPPDELECCCGIVDPAGELTSEP